MSNWKLFLLLPLLVFSLHGCGLIKALKPSTPAPVAQEEEPVDAVGRAVLNTVALWNADGERFCSGAVVEGAIFTALHCFLLDPEMKFVVEYDGRGYEGIFAKGWADYDLALIEAIGARLTDPLPMSDWDPVYGMEVAYLGYPLAGNLQFAMGRVSAPVDDQKLQFFNIQGQILPGHSGGPVLDERGHLLGIIAGSQAFPSEPVEIPQFLPIGYVLHPKHLREVLETF